MDNKLFEEVYCLLEQNFITKSLKLLSVHKTDKGAIDAMHGLVGYVIGDGSDYIVNKNDAEATISHCDYDGEVMKECRYFILKRKLFK